MKTGFPRRAASEAVPPVTVGPAVAGAGGRVAPDAWVAMTSTHSNDTQSSRPSIAHRLAAQRARAVAGLDVLQVADPRIRPRKALG